MQDGGARGALQAMDRAFDRLAADKGRMTKVIGGAGRRMLACAGQLLIGGGERNTSTPFADGMLVRAFIDVPSSSEER